MSNGHGGSTHGMEEQEREPSETITETAKDDFGHKLDGLAGNG